MDEDEERLTLKVWKARAEGAIIGAAFVLGVGFLLYLAAHAGPLNSMSVFLYSAAAEISAMAVLLMSPMAGDQGRLSC